MTTQTTQSDSVPGQSTANTKVTLTTAIADALQTILDENRRIADHVETSDADSLAVRLSQAGRVYVYGEGRSGLVIRMFAMRMMHLGKQTYVVGDTTTPAIAAGDLLIAISGSGTSRLVCDIAQEAKANGADVAVITASPQAPLSQSANLVVVIPAVSKQAQDSSLSVQFAGSLFEQSSLLLTDAIFHVLATREGKDATTLWAQHTNLE